MTPRASLLAIISRTLHAAWAGGGGLILPLGFFFGAGILLPLSLGPDSTELPIVAPGLIWVSLALSTLISLERIFQSELEVGGLDLLILIPIPLELIALVQTLAYWLVAGLPLALGAPILGVMLGLPIDALYSHWPGLILGSLIFFLWGGMGAALAAGVRRGGLLIALIVLPLYAPVAILGSLHMAQMSMQGVVLIDMQLMLVANLLIVLAITPFAMAMALRNATG